jgi:uncharacterized protein YecT (DUF1311 family)
VQRKYMFYKIKLARLVVIAASAGVLLVASETSAQERYCKSNDDCDQLAFEQAEKELAEFMPQALAFIDSFAAGGSREIAKSGLAEAQRHWTLFRDAACKAEAATFYLRSARTTAGYTARCLHDMTIQRLEDLKRRFLLRAGEHLGQQNTTSDGK